MGPCQAAMQLSERIWIMLRRLQPLVPCPENTPLPNRRISKDARAKYLSIYMRPWTLSQKMATAEVLFLLDLAKAPAGTAQQNSSEPSATEFRALWKQYIHNVLPHAERGVLSFMLACLAAGRAAGDDDEKKLGKGQLSFAT